MLQNNANIQKENLIKNWNYTYESSIFAKIKSIFLGWSNYMLIHTKYLLSPKYLLSQKYLLSPKTRKIGVMDIW